MKKISRALILLIFLISSTFVFAGCGEVVPVDLSRPIASVVTSNDRVTVMAIRDPNASSYVFGFYTGPYYNNASLYVEEETSQNYFDMTDVITSSQIYYFYARAIGDGVNYLDSVNSSIVHYDNSDTLPAPVLSLTGNILSWNGIPDSDGYEIYENNSLIEATYDTTYDVTDRIVSQIVYNYEVKAIGAEGNLLYKDSLKSNIVSYTEHLVLAVPENLQIQEIEGSDYLTWDAVMGAATYTVLVDGTTTNQVATNEVLLSTLAPLAKQYTFAVRTDATGILIASDYSTEIIYDNYIQLSTPSIIGASRNNGDVDVSWSEVPNAESYTLLVNGSPLLNDITGLPEIITATSVTIPGELEKVEGGFDLEVYANAYAYYLESETSELFAYGGIDELDSPLNLSVVNLSGTITASWDAVSGCNGYVVAINDDYYNVNSSTTSLDITGEIDPEAVVQVRVKATGIGYVTDSTYADAVMYNNTAYPITGYYNRYFYYYQYYDYTVRSQEEMNAALAYALNYHLTSIELYVDYALDSAELLLADELFGNNNGIADETEREIAEYKEYVGLTSYSETHSMTYMLPDPSGANQWEFTFGYDYDMDPTLESNDPDPYVQNTNFAPYSSATGRAVDYNDFASELSTIEVPVYNSENLFMAVNSGAKPLFMAEDSQAELVYETAKSVLRQIIDDSMTDYEKMLAIYDWVSYNTVYDKYVYAIATQDTTGWTQAQIDELQNTIPQYKVFYLEGVLLDGSAVCDGIAKTVAFLASMEGIEIVKINGTAGSTSSSVGHAWNKVYLDIDGVSNWYVIDATWGDGKINIGTYEEPIISEYLNHKYFLVTDADIEDTHFPESPFNPVADTDFNYFTETEYTAGSDYYITSQTELNDLMAYLIYNDIEGVEIYVSFNYGGSLADELSLAINLATYDDVTANWWTTTTSQKIMVDIVYA
ncbi:MAG: transglutaminase domain-containing protein [Spirochaetales bacterium]